MDVLSKFLRNWRVKCPGGYLIYANKCSPHYACNDCSNREKNSSVVRICRAIWFVSHEMHWLGSGNDDNLRSLITHSKRCCSHPCACLFVFNFNFHIIFSLWLVFCIREITTYKTMQLNGNELATVNSWIVRCRCQWQTTQNEIHWKGMDVGSLVHVWLPPPPFCLYLPFSLWFLSSHWLHMCPSENRFLFIQWKLIATINDCCVCVWLKWCGPWIESMWINWEYERRTTHRQTVHYSFHTLSMINAISLDWMNRPRWSIYHMFDDAE